jgi:predicted MFS family arabinose efflux permease
VVFLALAAAWPAVSGSRELAVLFIASFIANIGSALFNPAIFSMPVALAEGDRLQQLTALVNSCFSGGSILGPPLAAGLYAATGLRGLFLVNGLSYWLAAALEAGVRVRHAPEGAAPPPPDSAGRVLGSNELLRVMLLSFLASNLFLAPLMVFLPLFVKATYHGQIGTLALLETVFGATTVAGGLVLAVVRLDSRLGRKIVVGMVAVAVSYVGFSLASAPWAGVAWMALLGFFLATTNVFSMTLFQSRLEERNVPTFMSLVNLISVASLPVSMAALGLLITAFDVRKLAIGSSLGLLAVTLAVVTRRDLRRAT